MGPPAPPNTPCPRTPGKGDGAPIAPQVPSPFPGGQRPSETPTHHQLRGVLGGPPGGARGGGLQLCQHSAQPLQRHLLGAAGADHGRGLLPPGGDRMGPCHPSHGPPPAWIHTPRGISAQFPRTCQAWDGIQTWGRIQIPDPDRSPEAVPGDGEGRTPPRQDGMGGGRDPNHSSCTAAKTGSTGKAAAESAAPGMRPGTGKGRGGGMGGTGGAGMGNMGGRGPQHTTPGPPRGLRAPHSP